MSGADGVADRFGYGARSVQATVDVCPFQQQPVSNQALEAVGRYEVIVNPVDLSGPRSPGGRGDTEMQIWDPLKKTADQR